MSTGKVLQFPIRNPELFSSEINNQVLSTDQFSHILSAAIRALPHVSHLQVWNELKRALCDLLLPKQGVA